MLGSYFESEGIYEFCLLFILSAILFQLLKDTNVLNVFPNKLLIFWNENSEQFVSFRNKDSLLQDLYALCNDFAESNCWMF